MRRLFFVCLFGLVALQTSAADPRDAVLGIWKGTSICTKARSACHDEVVIYHVTAGDKANVVTLAMNKVVNGQELEMGSLDFTMDFAAHRMVGEFGGRVPSRWTFTWTKTEMKGTAVLIETGEVGRNIAVHR